MRSTDLPKPQEDFMRTIRNQLQVHVQSSEGPGYNPWVATDDRSDELEAMKEFFLIRGTTRSQINDAVDIRLEVDEQETELFKMLAKALEEKNPEKKDNLYVASLKITHDETDNGTIQGVPVPPHHVLRREFRKYFDLQPHDFKDPRVEQLLRTHQQMIARNPAEGFGAMTNWLSRFPDFAFMIHGYGKEDLHKLAARPMSRTHPWLFPEARMSFSAGYMPSMYVSAAIDNTSEEDKQSVLTGIEKSRKAWKTFWKSVIETQEA